ncbi:tautomerase family protein [Hydrogenophaga luteola]|uniref:4-oxalocrotonate tautomerase family protein n=1 Tax=Hydrogenophaga luteola TaxID=1591122 RepID=A0ABV7W255_9BURK
MPTLLLKVTPLQNPERYQALAAALTRLTADILHKRPEVTAVVIDDLPRARWCVGGRTVQGTAALLEIGITAGTNTQEEKAHFIAAAYDELQRQLAPDGGFEVASYVTVQERPATDWGYGGQTQWARQLARAVAAPAGSAVPP